MNLLHKGSTSNLLVSHVYIIWDELYKFVKIFQQVKSLLFLQSEIIHE